MKKVIILLVFIVLIIITGCLAPTRVNNLKTVLAIIQTVTKSF